MPKKPLLGGRYSKENTITRMKFNEFVCLDDDEIRISLKQRRKSG